MKLLGYVMYGGGLVLIVLSTIEISRLSNKLLYSCLALGYCFGICLAGLFDEIHKNIKKPKLNGGVGDDEDV